MYVKNIVGFQMNTFDRSEIKFMLCVRPQTADSFGFSLNGRLDHLIN